jgi:hypothetical protein
VARFHDRLISQAPVRGVVAAPLGDELTGVGALDLYCDRSDDVLQIDLADVRSVAGYITEMLIQTQLFPALRNGSLGTMIGGWETLASPGAAMY